MCNENNYFLNIEEILKLLPHRYPLLLIDRVLKYKANIYLKALKNVSINEIFFQGHFPSKKILPGVLIIEAMVQATYILLLKSQILFKSKKLSYKFVGISNARFKLPVVPGDQMIIKVIFIKMKHKIMKFQGFTLVNKKTVCKTEIIFMQD